jgi:hypothetical protein
MLSNQRATKGMMPVGSVEVVALLSDRGRSFCQLFKSVREVSPWHTKEAAVFRGYE